MTRIMLLQNRPFVPPPGLQSGALRHHETAPQNTTGTGALSHERGIPSRPR